VVTPTNPVDIGTRVIAGLPSITSSSTPAGFGSGSGAVVGPGAITLPADCLASAEDG